MMDVYGPLERVDERARAATAKHCWEFSLHQFVDPRAVFPPDIDHDEITTGFDVIVKRRDLVVFATEPDHAAFPGAVERPKHRQDRNRHGIGLPRQQLEHPTNEPDSKTNDAS